MHTNTTSPDPQDVDPEERDQVEEMYDRGVVTEKPRPAPSHAGPLSEALISPPLCPHGMNSLADRGYDLARARLRRG